MYWRACTRSAARSRPKADGPPGIDLSRVVVEPPRDAAHGDLATNAAMVLAKEAKAKPRELAEQIAEQAARRRSDRVGRGRRARLHQSDA